MEYIVRDYENNPHTYHLSYSRLKDDYYRIKEYSNQEFLENVGEILHFTSFICWFKEIGMNAALGDMGLVHELIHLTIKSESPFFSLDKYRETWNNLMRL